MFKNNLKEIEKLRAKNDLKNLKKIERIRAKNDLKNAKIMEDIRAENNNINTAYSVNLNSGIYEETVVIIISMMFIPIILTIAKIFNLTPILLVLSLISILSFTLLIFHQIIMLHVCVKIISFSLGSNDYETFLKEKYKKYENMLTVTKYMLLLSGMVSFISIIFIIFIGGCI